MSVCWDTAQALVFLLVSVCWGTAQALVFLLFLVCWDTTETLVFLLVSTCWDTAQALVFLLVSGCWDTAPSRGGVALSETCIQGFGEVFSAEPGNADWRCEFVSSSLTHNSAATRRVCWGHIYTCMECYLCMLLCSSLGVSTAHAFGFFPLSRARIIGDCVYRTLSCLCFLLLLLLPLSLSLSLSLAAIICMV